MNLSKEAVHSEASKLSAQLHLIHLINPEVIYFAFSPEHCY